MSRGFDTLIYTDCLPGQGLRGDPGLQFQARSAGVGARDMDLVQRALLYEPPTGWINEGKPVDDYPPSLAHVWDPSAGLLATAQGTYLGREVNAMRDGNQITHALVTTEPESYGFIRPAQLLHAPFWTMKPAPSTECPALPDGWQPGPWEPETIRDFVTAQKDGPRLLTTLLSAMFRLRQPHPSRVLFIAERAEEVLQWIAAATLLLPLRRALTVGFKVFTTNPSYCPQQILAMHPDWAGSYRSVDASSGFIVLDLITRRLTEAAVHEQAERWVELFLDADPYDVMDAVELASLVAEAGAEPRQAYAVAGAVTFGAISRRGEIPLAANWIADGAFDLVSDHGEAVVDTLLDQASVRDLRCLDTAAVNGRVLKSAAAIRAALLRGEIDSALSGAQIPSHRLASLTVAEFRNDQRMAGAEMVINVLHSAPLESIDALLRTAWRHRIVMPAVAFADQAALFASWWADRPDLTYDPAFWPDGDGMVRVLRRELSRRLSPSSALREKTVGAVRRAWWRLLLETAVDTNELLDSVIMVGAMGGADEQARHALVRRVMTDAASAPNPAAASARACEVLWCDRYPEALEALAALEIIPGRVAVGPILTDAVTQALVTRWPRGDLASALDAVRIIRARKADVPPNWRDRHEADVLLQDICGRLARSSDQERKLLKALHGIDKAVVAARAGQIAAALRQVDDPDFVAAALADLPDQVGQMLAGLLARDYTSHPGETIRREFMLLQAKRLAQPLRKRLDNELRAQLKRGNQNLESSVTRLLAKDGKAIQSDWNDWLITLNSQPRRPTK